MSIARIFIGTTIAAGLAGGLVWAFLPEPMAVDLALAERGPMQLTVTADGITRVREPFTITAPISGTTTRSPVQVGDSVDLGATVVAVIQPADPALMDARSRALAEAAVDEAVAALQLAQTSVVRSETALNYAVQQFERGRALAQSGTIPQRMLEDLEQGVTAATQAVSAATAERELAQASLMRAQAQLLGPSVQARPNGPQGECCVQILAPLTGTVLSVTDRNARQVNAGMPLLSIGDISDLEIEIDLLSGDAVRVPADAAAIVERWGGEGVLEARVRRVEPAAFTRVSALGIEEQRVRVHLDLLTPPQSRVGLGDQFRVLVHVVIWQGEDILQIPLSALFRHEGGWAVFRLHDGRGVLTPVQIGRQTRSTSEILGGLTTGDQVVLYPSSALSDAAKIAPR